MFLKFKCLCKTRVQIKVVLCYVNVFSSNENMNDIMNEVEFWSDQTTDYVVSCP